MRSENLKILVSTERILDDMCNSLRVILPQPVLAVDAMSRSASFMSFVMMGARKKILVMLTRWL